MTGRSQRCWPIRQVRRVSSATHSFEHFFGGVQLKWALFWANDWNLTLLSNPLFFEHFFELITHKSTFLSALLINETFLNTFLRTQKSGFALKSAFLSGFTLLRAFLSAQKSAQGPAEPLCVRHHSSPTSLLCCVLWYSIIVIILFIFLFAFVFHISILFTSAGVAAFPGSLSSPTPAPLPCCIV